MERVIPFIRQTRVFVFACAIGVFAMLVAFAPSLGHPFMSDDYQILASLANEPKNLAFFFAGNGRYMIPVTKLLWVTEYALFGTQEFGYHFVSLFLHIVNTVLVVLFFTRIFKSKWMGLLTGAFFALSASHWRTAMWMSAQMKLLAALFLLIALLFFHSYLRTGAWRPLLMTVLAQMAMPFTSALGIELPLILSLLYLYENHTEPKRLRVPPKRVWWTIAALCALCMIYVFLQRLLYPHTNEYFLSGHGLLVALVHLLRAGQWLLAGLFEGFGHSMTGFFIGANISIFPLPAVPVPATIRFIPLGILLILLLLPKHRNWWKPALLFVAWTVVLYAPPIFPDLAQGYITDWFVTRARYFYVAAIPVAALMTVLLTHVQMRFFKRRPIARKALFVVLVLFGATVLFSNLQRVMTLESYASDYTSGFAMVRDAYVQDLKTVLRQTWGTRVFTVSDVPLGKTTGFDYAGHNVLPSHLADLYLTPSERATFRFMPEGVPADFGVTGNGKLWPSVGQ